MDFPAINTVGINNMKPEYKKLSDNALAHRQSTYKPDSGPYKVCDLEFKRRERWKNVVPSMLLVAFGFLLGLIPWIIDKVSEKPIQQIEIVNTNDLQKIYDSNKSSEPAGKAQAVESER
jgi:hypothetical protein